MAILVIGLVSSYYQFFIFLSPNSLHAPVSLGSKDTIAACEWARTNTPARSIFVTDEKIENGACIYALSGRRAFLSVPYFVSTHGIDVYAIKLQQDAVLGGDLALAKNYGITHIFSTPALEKHISDSLRANIDEIYSSGGTIIYLIKYP
jgi:hypothetical protein